MRLLPDFEMDGIMFSLQYPYTIKGHLIVGILEDVSLATEEDIITFEIDDGRSYTYKKMRLLNSFSRCFSAYTDIYGMTYVDENEYILPIPFNNFISWLQGIQLQTDVLASDSFSYLGRPVLYYGNERGEKWFSLLNTLKNQNRDEAYEREIITVERNQISGFGTTVATNSTCPDTRQIISEPFISSAPGKSHIYIHSYNYKPKFIKHTNSSSSLLLGVEIEVAGNKHEPNRDEVVKKCIQIMNGSDSDEENLIYSTHDGTVQIELDTMPCSLEVHKTLNYKEMFKYLVSIGYRGHDCKNAGMHIHVDREYLGDTKFKQQLVISKIIYILEKFNDDICVIARKNHDYSQFIGKPGETIFDLYRSYKNYGKRAALNLQHDETIEFRCFRSTLKYETFILTLEFVQCIVDFAKTINIEEIESVAWQDLMAKFPKSVQDYYKNRKQREGARQKDPILKDLKKAVEKS